MRGCLRSGPSFCDQTGVMPQNTGRTGISADNPVGMLMGGQKPSCGPANRFYGNLRGCVTTPMSGMSGHSGMWERSPIRLRASSTSSRTACCKPDRKIGVSRSQAPAATSSWPVSTPPRITDLASTGSTAMIAAMRPFHPAWLEDRKAQGGHHHQRQGYILDQLRYPEIGFAMIAPALTPLGIRARLRHRLTWISCHKATQN